MKKASYNKKLYIALIFLTFMLYWPTLGFDFINYDDPSYINENRLVRNGFKSFNFHDFITQKTGGNIHPVTLMTHILDVQIFGMNAGAHHLTSLLIHIANSVLLFYFLSKVSEDEKKSFMVAVLFCLHPINFDSVIWLSERKTLVCTFFWLLTLLFYVKYVERQDKAFYLMAFLSFIIGFFAKPIIVTLPFCLMLLDYWPLNRYQKSKTVLIDLKRFVLYEKFPLIVVSTLFCFVTIFSQNFIIEATVDYSIGIRLSNAVVSYVRYLNNLLLPLDLSIHYPHMGMPETRKILISIVILSFISVYALINRNKYPYFIIGWLWFVGNLIPVIGIIQVGSQAMADRYAYVPFIGLYLIIVWHLFEVLKTNINLIKIIYLVFILFLFVAGLYQIRFWKSSITIFTRALMVTEKNDVACNNLAIELFKQNKTNDAIELLNNSIKYNKRYFTASVNLSKALIAIGDYNKAEKILIEVLKDDKKNYNAYRLLGKVHFNQGKIETAINNLANAIKINQYDAESYYVLGLIAMGKEYYNEAIDMFTNALNYGYSNEKINKNIKDCIKQRDANEKEITRILATINYYPNNYSLYFKLGKLYLQKGQHKLAIDYFKKSLAINSDNEDALFQLAVAYAKINEYEQAIMSFNDLLGYNKTRMDIYYNIAALYSLLGNNKLSYNWLRQAKEKKYVEYDILKNSDNFTNFRKSEYYKLFISE